MLTLEELSLGDSTHNETLSSLALLASEQKNHTRFWEFRRRRRANAPDLAPRQRNAESWR